VTARVEPIVIATDGLPQSRGAFATARALATAAGSALHVVAVHRSMTMVVPDGQLLIDPNVEASLRADLVQRVRAQCTRADGTVIDDYEVLNGAPAQVICDLAHGRHARIIVVGLGRHELVDRLFGDETALKVARASTVPVLAVPEAAGAARPRHAIVGVDFSEGSVRAAQVVLRLLPGDGVLELVHVIPRERLLYDAWVSQEEYARYVRHSLTRFRARLEMPDGVRVEDVVRSGDPGNELLSYARLGGADLIAAGSHGHGFITRLVVGSVTTKLLRSSTCAVLVVPPDARNTDLRRAGADATLNLERSRWIEVLDDFTRRNVGRQTRLEVDDPELGAQPQEHRYPLLGVTFDPVDQRVEIMLGELGSGEPHLSRSVGGVESLDVLTNRDDQDVALRLKHGRGQTLLTLIR
jgi:nucleotide-binding universal stress UspA family protein